MFLADFITPPMEQLSSPLSYFRLLISLPAPTSKPSPGTFIYQLLSRFIAKITHFMPTRVIVVNLSIVDTMDSRWLKYQPPAARIIIYIATLPIAHSLLMIFFISLVYISLVFSRFLELSLISLIIYFNYHSHYTANTKTTCIACFHKMDAFLSILVISFHIRTSFPEIEGSLDDL